ncbi:MAG TPA: DUF5985 family protein [Vicinamibacterales bacterium]|nr:DUF5985 family protein [Vicinamibacterales bacterium]
MTHDIVVFLQGVSSMGAYTSGVFFLRFWRERREPLFAFLGLAFLFIGLSWTLAALFSPGEETRPYVYGLRLIAFALIIAGIVRKNRQATS